MSEFPRKRMQRLRRHGHIRNLVEETTIRADQLISPMFVVEHDSMAGPISAMPGVHRLTLDEVEKECEELSSLGLGTVLLFGVPGSKDLSGSIACAADSVVVKAIERCKRSSDLAIFTDVCLCSYLDHGHCGVYRDEVLDNDATLDILSSMAVSHALAGADFVAPSAMMDGQVAAIRERLDKNGLSHAGILSYAAKFASSYFGPFREAADSAPQYGDRRGYQMNPANRREALAEVELDLAEGADMVMVKPAMPYLDIIRDGRERFPNVPWVAYQVSGEYAMIKAAAQQGWLDEARVVNESLLAIRRAGADAVISYFARDVAKSLRR